MRQRKLLTLLSTTLLAAALAAPASAAVEEGTHSFEIYAGVYFTDLPGFDEAATYGIRFGHVFTQRWGMEISGGFYSDDFDNAAGTINTDLDIISVDIDGQFFFNPDARAVVFLEGGIGWATADADVTTKATGASVSADADSFTANLGLGTRITLGEAERMFVRLDARARWFEDRDDDEIDFEATLGLGWIWGGGY